jgi:hypothetical protein
MLSRAGQKTEQSETLDVMAPLSIHFFFNGNGSVVRFITNHFFIKERDLAVVPKQEPQKRLSCTTPAENKNL